MKRKTEVWHQYRTMEGAYKRGKRDGRRQKVTTSYEHGYWAGFEDGRKIAEKYVLEWLQRNPRMRRVAEKQFARKVEDWVKFRS